MYVWPLKGWILPFCEALSRQWYAAIPATCFLQAPECSFVSKLNSSTTLCSTRVPLPAARSKPIFTSYTWFRFHSLVGLKCTCSARRSPLTLPLAISTPSFPETALLLLLEGQHLAPSIHCQTSCTRGSAAENGTIVYNASGYTVATNAYALALFPPNSTNTNKCARMLNIPNENSRKTRLKKKNTVGSKL